MPRFVNLDTGLRARYFEWGDADAVEVVLLLHDVGHSGEKP